MKTKELKEKRSSTAPYKKEKQETGKYFAMFAGFSKISAREATVSYTFKKTTSTCYCFTI